MTALQTRGFTQLTYTCLANRVFIAMKNKLNLLNFDFFSQSIELGTTYLFLELKQCLLSTAVYI